MFQNILSECKAELYIPFNSDTKDYSGNHLHVENQNVTVIGNGLGYFDGNARLIINRFSNIDFYTDFVVKMRYLDDPGASSSGLQALFSNSDCCDSAATMMLVKSRNNLHFMAKTEVKSKNETTDRLTAFHLPAMVLILSYLTTLLKKTLAQNGFSVNISYILKLHMHFDFQKFITLRNYDDNIVKM
jgi:hypothetical protein